MAGGPREMGQMVWTVVLGDKKVLCGSPSETRANLIELKELLEIGAMHPVIDRQYPLPPRHRGSWGRAAATARGQRTQISANGASAPACVAVDGPVASGHETAALQALLARGQFDDQARA